MLFNVTKSTMIRIYEKIKAPKCQNDKSIVLHNLRFYELRKKNKTKPVQKK